MVMRRRWRCGCVMCLRFSYDHDWGYEPKHRWREGTCGLCGDKSRSTDGRLYRPIMPWVPDLLAEFLGTRDVCWCCRNVIQGYVRKWKACWSNSPDEVLKWALLEAVLEYFFRRHLTTACVIWSGHKRKGGFVEHPCCKNGHGVERTTHEHSARSG